MLGHNLAEGQICLLYYVWARNDSTSYCCLEDSDTCYARSYYLAQRFNLEAVGYLESDPNDKTFIRLSAKGRTLILQLGM